jgi:hypothetical protein
MDVRSLGWLAALAALSCSGAEPSRPNVLLITVDTLRADRLGCYGYARETSPRLDELAKEAVVFDRASTPRAKTTPAIASLLTGVYPHEHGVRDLAQPLGSDVGMLQEELAQAGYRTGAIVGNWVLGNERSGLARGFDLWCESLPDSGGVPPDDVPQRSARSMTDAALVALGLREAPGEDVAFEPTGRFVVDGAPWFLWLHYMDPHGAYEPPQEHRVFASEAEIVDPEAARDERHPTWVADYNVPEGAKLENGTFDAAKVRDLYDGEVRYVDAEIGRLLDALRERGELGSTLVVVTADHGESLGEHRYWFEHGRYAYESTNRVPLIVRAPGGGAAGRDGRVVSLVDVGEMVKLEAGLAAQRVAGDVAFYEKVERTDLEGAVQIKGVRVGDWKLVQRYAPRVRDGRREVVLVGEELFDLAKDPLEAWDLAAVGAGSRAPMARLRRELAGFVEADRELAEIGEVLARRRKGIVERDPETERLLKALGY